MSFRKGWSSWRRNDFFVPVFCSVVFVIGYFVILQSLFLLMVFLPFFSPWTQFQFYPILLKFFILIDGFIVKFRFPLFFATQFSSVIDWLIDVYLLFFKMEDFGFIWCVSPFQIVIVVFISGALHMLRIFCFISGKFSLHCVFRTWNLIVFFLLFFFKSFESVCLYCSFFCFCVIVSCNPFVYLIFLYFSFIFSYLLYVLYKVYCLVVNLFCYILS